MVTPWVLIAGILLILIGGYLYFNPSTLQTTEKTQILTPSPSVLLTPVPTIKKTVINNLPVDVYPEQITNSIYNINNVTYALVLQPNMNYDLSDLRDKEIKWHGVLQSLDEGISWKKFFSIKDPTDKQGQKIKYNPVGVFSDAGLIYVDIANDHGAGSGEGEMIRFLTRDEGKTWQKRDCYYFTPEDYYTNYSNYTNGKANTDKINPYNLRIIKNCPY